MRALYPRTAPVSNLIASTAGVCPFHSRCRTCLDAEPGSHLRLVWLFGDCFWQGTAKTCALFDSDGHWT